MNLRKISSREQTACFIIGFALSFFLVARIVSSGSSESASGERWNKSSKISERAGFVNHASLISDRRKRATTGLGENASIHIRQCFKLYGDDGKIPFMLAELAGLDIANKKIADEIVNRAWVQWENVLAQHTSCERNIANGEIIYQISKFHDEALEVLEQMKTELEVTFGKHAKNLLLAAFDEKLYFISLGDREITLRYLRNTDGEWIPYYTDEKNNMIEIACDIGSLRKKWGSATPTAPNE